MKLKKEEELAQRRANVDARAKEAAKKAKEAADLEKKLAAEERQARKENRCGGGFNMAKAKKKE